MAVRFVGRHAEELLTKCHFVQKNTMSFVTDRLFKINFWRTSDVVLFLV